MVSLQALTWSGKPVRVLPAATEAEQADVLQPLLDIDPTFDFAADANSKGLEGHPALQDYLRKHTRSDLYMFQWLADPPELPYLPLRDAAEPAVAPDAALADLAPSDPVSSMRHQLPWVPAPVPLDRLPAELRARLPADFSEGKQYAPFELVSGYEPDYSFAPSKSQPAALALKVSKECSAKNLRATATCRICSKSRGVFSKKAFVTLRGELKQKGHNKNYLDDELDAALDEDSLWSCGAGLFLIEHPLFGSVFTNTDLQCSSPMEPALYAGLNALQNWEPGDFSFDLCAACGTEHVPAEELALLGCSETEDFADWQKYPLCQSCSDAGTAPIAVDRSKKKKTKAAAKSSVVKQKRAAAAARRQQASRRSASNSGGGSGDEDDVEISGSDDDDHAGGGAGPSTSASKRPRRACAQPQGGGPQLLRELGGSSDEGDSSDEVEFDGRSGR